MAALRIYTGDACTCRRGIERDNCPACEGTGRALDFPAIRAACAEAREFVCGTRRVETSAVRPGYFRVICATCRGGGTVYHSTREAANAAAVRDSARPCPVGCGAR